MAFDMDIRGGNFSVVENFNENEGYKCGYCKSKTSNYSHGMWAHQLTVHDYQDLIDRGWRRSGNYCYKPSMQKICCPMYTIKCNATEFKLSKSQKKVIKRMNRFLTCGERGKQRSADDDSSSEGPQESVGGNAEWMEGQAAAHFSAADGEKFLQFKSSLQQQSASGAEGKLISTVTSPPESSNIKTETKAETAKPNLSSLDTSKDSHCPKQGAGPDKEKPPCKKAKLVRLERRQQKLAGKVLNSALPVQKHDNTQKSLEDFLHPENHQNPAHRLQVRLVRSQPPSAEFKNSLVESLNVYRRYQMAVHGDPESKCTESQYKRFLVKSPLELKLVRSDSISSFDLMWRLFAKYQKEIHKETEEECDREAFQHFLVDTPLEVCGRNFRSDDVFFKVWRPADGSGPPQGYGSFHQQYWLDDKLVAVGVIDILPRCVSSVYFYYDPDFADLTLGTFGSLREVAFVRTLNVNAPDIKWYYMGFYIHSCLKMRYKAGLSPSFLLCPETYMWYPIEHCLPLLDKQKYSRLEPDPSAVDTNLLNDVNEVVVLYDLSPMYYGRYRVLKGSVSESEDEEVSHYAELVGRICAKRMFLWR